MSFLRRSLFGPLFLLLLIAASASFGLVYDITAFNPLSQAQSVFVALGTFFLLTLFIYWWEVDRPMSKIIHEMKALLTGKPYRRVMTTKENEIGILAHFFNEITRNLESISGDVKTHKRLRKEIDSAQDIQRMLIPKSAPEIPGLDVVAKTRPASEIGGDTFDFYNKGDRHILYIGDSTGHGLPAGIVMVMVDALLETFIDIKESLVDIMVSLNKYLKPHLKPSMFMTMILLEWNPKNGVLTWVGGGHEYLVHMKTKQGQIESIKAGGIAVGMLADNSRLVQVQSMTLEEGDFVVLYTDGITEAKNRQGEEFGLKRLCDFIQSQVSEDMTPDQLFQKIAIEVGQFMEGSIQLDDMTLIVLKHTTRHVKIVDTTTEWQAAA
jgi:hypothetical protein